MTHPDPLEPCTLEQLDNLVVQAPLFGYSKEHVICSNAIAALPSFCRVSHGQRCESLNEERVQMARASGQQWTGTVEQEKL